MGGKVKQEEGTMPKMEVSDSSSLQNTKTKQNTVIQVS